MAKRTKQENLKTQFERFKKNIVGINERAFGFAVGKATREALLSGRKEVRRGLKGSAEFPNSLRSKIYDKPGKLADSLIYSKVKYGRLFEEGGVINSKNKFLFVPIMPGGKKPYKNGFETASDFREQVLRLINTRKAFVENTSPGVFVVLVKVDKKSISSKTLLKPFLSTYRAQQGIKQAKDGMSIPVALFKRQTKISKKFNFKSAVTEVYLRNLPTYFKQRLAVLSR